MYIIKNIGSTCKCTACLEMKTPRHDKKTTMPTNYVAYLVQKIYNWPTFLLWYAPTRASECGHSAC